jgi:hypothetical protein
MPNYVDVTERNVSFPLIRTNPKLTSNVKLTVDSSGSIWLNSIDATEELANQKYKKFALNEGSSHEVNLHRFYDFGKTPTKISFAVGSTVNKDAAAKDLKDQYDFGFYTSGAKYLSARQYSEKFTYFAPIYLDTVIPQRFVILKVPGAANYTAGEGRSLSTNQTISSFSTDLFKNATLIKSYDIGPDSKLGKYIQGIIKNPMFDIDPLYVNFRAGGYSIYRGASISSGTYVEIPERLDTIFSKSLPQLKVEQYVTNGFERNNIVHPRLLNLEFLFDDDTSDDYSFNRYIGFYCNEIELDTVQIDLQKMYLNSISNESYNEQIHPKLYSQADDVYFRLTNENGVKLSAFGLDQDLSDISNNRTDKDTLFFPYMKTRDSQLHLIKPESWDQDGTRVTFSIDDTEINFGSTFGPTELITQENVTVSTTDTRSTVRVEIVNKPDHLDKIRVYHPSGSSSDSEGRYDDLVFTRGYLTINEAYVFGTSVYINADRDLDLISKAIADVILRLTNSSIFATQMKNTCFIQARRVGNTYGTLKVKVTEAISPKVKVNGTTTSSVVYADGGFLNEAHPIVPYGNAERLESQIDDIVIKTTNGWSRIARVYPSSDLIKSGLSEADQAAAISSYENSEVIMIEDFGEIADTSYNRIEIRKLFKPKIGILSIFEINDFDFSTYKSNYSRTLELDLYKDFYIPEGINIIDFTKYTYSVIGDGTISINNINYTSDDVFIWQSSTAVTNYRIVDGNPILVKSPRLPDLVNKRLDLSYFDESNEAVDYVGPFSVKAYHSQPDPNSKTYEYKDKFLYGNVSSEYNVYLENYIEDFATEGRVVPYIAKWGIIDSTDSRDNPYRLNSDILFGKNNFGPSNHETLPTSEKLTHEWFYIESDFDYSLDPSLIKKNFSYFATSLDIENLSTESTYFDEYFTYVPTVDGIEVDRPQFRYSTLYQNDFNGNYETVFKGAKYIFYETDRNGTRINPTGRFDQYRFSVVLKPIKETLYETRKPVNYRVIENTNSKSIVVVVELVLGHKELIPKTMLIDGWGFNGSSGTSGLDYIDQSTVFTNFFYGDQVEYSIDLIVTAPNLYQYNAMTSGLIPIPGASLGQTVCLTFDDPLSSTFYSSIIATSGTDVYAAIKAGQISSGDQINSAYPCTVYPSGVVTIGPGTYVSTRIEVINTAAISASPFQVNRNIPYFDSMLGDYRIEFNENGVSNLTHSFMYYAKHKKYNTEKTAYSTIKLSRGVDLSVSGIFPGFLALNTVRLTGLENYDSQMNSEIDSVINTFSPIYIVNEGSRKIMVQTSTSSIGVVTDLLDPDVTGSGITGANQTTLSLSPSTSLSYLLINQPPILSNPISYTIPAYPFGTIGVWTTPASTYYSLDALPSSTTAVWKNSIAQLQIFGGAKYHEKLFEAVSFAKFSQLLRAGQEIISWESYTNGILSSTRKISMITEEAETVNKNTMVKLDTVSVTINQVNGVAGFAVTEVPSTQYEVYRYSGEYDVIFRRVSGFKYDFWINQVQLIGANCCLNTEVDNFFTLPDFEYVKYSKNTILDLENSQNYKSVYPYIAESAIDRTDYNVLASSWDYDYHFEYLDKKTKKKVAGSKRITEDYSFVSKLLNLPNQVTVEDFSIGQVSNTDFIQSRFGPYDLIQSTFNNEVRFKINLPEVMAKVLSNNGIRQEFRKFFKYLDNSDIVSDSDILGDLSFEEFLRQYCLRNLVNLYQIGTFEFYELEDRSISQNSIVLENVSISQLSSLGYVITNSVKINNTKTEVIEGSMMIKPNSGIKLIPKIKMQYI